MSNYACPRQNYLSNRRKAIEMFWTFEEDE